MSHSQLSNGPSPSWKKRVSLAILHYLAQPTGDYQPFASPRPKLILNCLECRLDERPSEIQAYRMVTAKPFDLPNGKLRSWYGKRTWQVQSLSHPPTMSMRYMCLA